MTSGKISKATSVDITELNRLINRAYRGQEAKKGWTHEADLISGELRTDENDLRSLISDPDAVILKYELEHQIAGCVYLHKNNKVLYLGMLTVSPGLQDQGIGKQLLLAAEQHAKESGCSSIEMNVITQRKELIAWYERNGYRLTGKTKPFHTEPRFGLPVKPVEFVVMEKLLANSHQPLA